MRSHRTKVVLLAAVFCILIRPAAARAEDEPPAEYLSDGLSERIVSVTQGWGELGFNTAVRPLYKPAMNLRIKDTDYQHGLGHHASGEIAVELGKQFKTFQTDVGIQWQGGKTWRR